MALVLTAILVASVVGASLPFTGTVAAAGNDPTATIDSLSPTTVAGAGNVDITYDATDGSDGDSAAVSSAQLQFIDADENTIDKTVDVDAGTGKTVPVTAPNENGTFNVQLTVEDENGNTAQSSVKEVVVDTEGPDVSIVAPEESADETSHPPLAATAVDNVDVQSVEFRIKHDGQYWDGSEWVEDPAWVATDYQADSDTWNVSENDRPTGDGSYTAVARATDSVGHTTKSNLDSSVELPGDGDVTYTVDSEKPNFKGDGVTVTVTDTNDWVDVGDDVTVEAEVTDATSGVESVTVNATAFGEGDALALTDGDDDDVWQTTFTVTDITVPDGPHDLTVNATDEFGLSKEQTSSDFTINTQPAAVDDITVDAEFVGVVEDREVRVTATGIVDENGNPIDVGTVDISVAGETPFKSVGVSDGSIDAKIDPTKLSHSLTLGEPVTVNVVGTGTATTAEVTLAHEVRTMEKGWHVGGTPMPARDVLISGNGTIMTYDKTAAGDWRRVTNPTAYLAQAGAGYYFNVTSDRARVGYVFDESPDEQVWTLNEGVNLVGVVEEIDKETGATQGSVSTTLNDLKSYVANDEDATLTYHVRKSADDTPLDELVGTTSSTSDSSEVLAYSSYIIEVETSGDKPVTYTVGLEGYDPEEKPN